MDDDDGNLEDDSELMAELLALQGETSAPKTKVPRTVAATAVRSTKGIDGLFQ